MYLLFFLLWVIFNGSLTPEICILGLLLAAAVFAFVCRFMDYSVKKELRNYKKVFLLIRYCGCLVTEIVKANMGVIRLILTQREEAEPVLVTFRSDLETAAGKALLANAITLTPGTITVTLEDSEYVVHCLDESMAEGINESRFTEYIRELER